jgi:hypothetical protein
MNTKNQISLSDAGFLIGAFDEALLMSVRILKIIRRRRWRRARQEEDPEKEEILSISLDELKIFGFGRKLVFRLSDATYHHFARIEPIKQEPQVRNLIYLTEEDILKIPGIGTKRRDLLVKGLLKLGVPEQMIRFRRQM